MIKGISFFGKETKILQYADDTALFIDGACGSLSSIVHILQSLERSSGLKINFDKTNIFPLGPLALNKPHFLDEFRLTGR